MVFAFFLLRFSCPFAGDVRAFEQFVVEVRNTLHGWGRDRFDYLVNNAGTSLHAAFEQTTEAEFDAVMNVHFKGVYFLSQRRPGALTLRLPPPPLPCQP